MPIYTYYCDGCGNDFEFLWTAEEVKKWPRVEHWVICKHCEELSRRTMAKFFYNQIGKISGIDDTDELTLGKLVFEGKIPAEHRPTSLEIKKRENKKQSDKEYLGRVKNYGLDKTTPQEEIG